MIGVLLTFVPSALAGDSLDDALHQLYNLELEKLQVTLDAVETERPDDPMVPVTRASAYLLGEMDRVGLLRSEFYQDRGKKLRKLRFTPSASVRESLFASLALSRELAERRLETNPRDAEAYFALALAAGVECNYAIFIEKKRFHALALARLSHRNALRAIAADPDYSDAYLIPGVNEYVVGSFPFFVRWIVHFEQVKGSKKKGIERLDYVNRTGHYVAPLARTILVMIYIREKRFEEARELTAELARQYPDNPLFRNELKKLDEKLGPRVTAGL